MRTPISSLLIFLVLFSSFSCIAKKKPKWVKSRPVEAGYWVGVARVEKAGTPNYEEKAKNIALTNIVSEISIQINSTTTQSQFEENYQVSDKFQSDINTRVKANLTGYELVGAWENKQEYWVYYRLSIQKWKQLERERIEKLISRAKSFYNQGIDEKEKNNLATSTRYFAQAFDVLKNNLHEDLRTLVQGRGNVDFPSEIVYQITDNFNTLHFSTEEEIDIPKKGRLITITITNNKTGATVANYPLQFNNQRDVEKSFTSNRTGIVTVHSDELFFKSGHHNFTLMPDANALIGEKKSDNLLRQVLDNKAVYKTKNIRAYYAKPTAILIDKNPSKDHAFIITEIKSLFSKDYFDFIKDETKAEYILKLSSSHREGEYIEKYDLSTVFVNASISITKTENNKELYFFTYDNVKGLKKGGVDKALREAFIKLESLIKADIENKIKL